jgi:hypothetical protein
MPEPAEVRQQWAEKDERLQHLMLAMHHELLDNCPSGPLFGEYMRAGYPNWATKYFLDALLLQERLSQYRIQ